MGKVVQSYNPVNDNPNLKITSHLQDDLNYVLWAQSMKLFIGGRGKIRFLLGMEKELAESNLKYANWFSDDLTFLSVDDKPIVIQKEKHNAREAL
ncbi:hypothetical protein GIB67_014219 [Kingdonia uniflora]|uniref:Retrotransposon Copia-like N-terminal domain-containing protein n=1 Tax=Kingdonia uniflora TaxID=39325 RepID=A0A7J7M230_9MAGN|nr:hypothetical protein GIB67_014219 [Kingdonia uniflora]